MYQEAIRKRFIDPLVRESKPYVAEGASHTAFPAQHTGIA